MIPIKNFTPIGTKPTELPPGYRECEYLESTGTQYIDTEVKASYLGEWVLDAQLTNISITSCQINGVYTAGDISMDIGTYQNCWLLKNGGYAWMDSTKRAHDTLRHKFVLSQIDKFGSIDGEVYVNSGCYVDVSKYPDLRTVWLFNRNNGNNDYKYWCYEKIYSSTMRTRDGVLMQNLVPALDPSGVPCMYDTVSRKAFYNAGTGTFKYKLKHQWDYYQLPSGYTRLKYLIFDGNQYLKDVILPYDFTAEFVVIPKEHTAYHNIYDDLSSNVMLWLRPDKKYELNISGISSTTYSSKLTELKVIQTGTTHKLYVDGEYATQTTGRYVPTGGLSVSLFHRKANGQCFRGSVGRVSVYDSSGNLVLNLIPALDPNKVACMYDPISGDAYYNEGSGNFDYV